MEFIDIDPFCTIVAAGKLVVQFYPGELDITVPRLRRIGQVNQDLARRHGKVLSFTVTDANKAMKFPAEVRDYARQLRADARVITCAAATVLGGTGIGATIVRTFVVTLTAFSKPPYPEKIFSELEEGMLWASRLAEADGLPLATIRAACERAESEGKAAAVMAKRAPA